MEKSQEINELLKALSAFQGEMKVVFFDSANPFFKSSYASLSALVESSKTLLSKNGLSVSQLVCEDGAVETLLGHSSGQWISSKLKIAPVKADPQGIGSAITYARRYAYAAILGLVSDADDDGNKANDNESKVKPNVQMPIKKAV